MSIVSSSDMLRQRSLVSWDAPAFSLFGVNLSYGWGTVHCVAFIARSLSICLAETRKVILAVGCIAQLAELQTFNLMVIGSSPIAPIANSVYIRSQKRSRKGGGGGKFPFFASFQSLQQFLSVRYMT